MLEYIENTCRQDCRIGFVNPIKLHSIALFAQRLPTHNRTVFYDGMNMAVYNHPRPQTAFLTKVLLYASKAVESGFTLSEVKKVENLTFIALVIIVS